MEHVLLESFCNFLLEKEVYSYHEYIESYLKHKEDDKHKTEARQNRSINEEVFPSVEVFTDGSVLNNGKKNSKGGYGVFIDGVYEKSFSYDQDFEGSPATNQNCELLAIHEAIEYIKKSKNKVFTIYSDSLYSIKCITLWSKAWEKNGWVNSQGETVKNQDIIKSILNNIKNLGDKKIHFVHINSHRSPPKDKNSKEYRIWRGNDLVDQLAKDGMKRNKN
jgi:ribonuclease HI